MTYINGDFKFSNKIEDSVMNVEQKNAKKGVGYYPCLCEAIDLALRFGRLFGVCPIAPINQGRHSTGCHFAVQRKWFVYSCVIQAIYFPYFLVMYSIRLHCGPNPSNELQWYVMTAGYVIIDLDSLCTLTSGVFLSKRTCVILEKLSMLPESIKEMQRLQKMLKRYIVTLLSFYSLVMTSYVYVGCLRISTGVTVSLDDYCDVLEFPHAVFLRGFTLIFPTIEVVVIATLCILIRAKYLHLGEKTQLTVEISSATPASGECVPNSLKQLAKDHKEISLCLDETNSCVGLQILVGTSSCLYTTIYYLYRYSMSSRDTISSNTQERVHYIIGLGYRMAKLFVYMILGQLIEVSSIRPLRVLQEAELINMPFRLQQQVQTLILQWIGKKGTLSALGVIKMGPWLLVPIVGNVITYLLIALQFETTINPMTNVTGILESFF